MRTILVILALALAVSAADAQQCGTRRVDQANIDIGVTGTRQVCDRCNNPPVAAPIPQTAPAPPVAIPFGGASAHAEAGGSIVMQYTPVAPPVGYTYGFRYGYRYAPQPADNSAAVAAAVAAALGASQAAPPAPVVAVPQPSVSASAQAFGADDQLALGGCGAGGCGVSRSRSVAVSRRFFLPRILPRSRSVAFSRTVQR